MTVNEALTKAAGDLETAGVENPRIEAEALMAHTLGAGRACVYARLREALDKEASEAFFALVKRRFSREPAQYITGEAEFLGLKFLAARGALIPRPETELLVDEGVARLRGREDALAADLGTGSGCIAVSLAVGLPGVKVYAVDSSRAALGVAGRNAAYHGVEGRVRLLEGDLFGPLAAEGLHGRLDLVVSNPPYIPSGDIPGLQPEVLFEPVSALDGGPDGLDVIKRIIRDAPAYLKPGGALLVEIGFGQEEAVRALAADEPGLEFIGFLKDFAGIDRALVAQGK